MTEFIHGCSPDPATRTMATTALVLTFWQLGGRSLTPRLPSMILVNTEEAETDPIDAVASYCANGFGKSKPGVQTTGSFAHGSVELAPKAMLNAVRTREQLGKPSQDTGRHLLPRALPVGSPYRASWPSPPPYREHPPFPPQPPPSGPARRLVQGPPVRSKFLAANQAGPTNRLPDASRKRDGN